MAIVYKSLVLAPGQNYIKLLNSTSDEHHIISIIPYTDIREGLEIVVDLGGVAEGAGVSSILSLVDRNDCLVMPISGAITALTTPNIKLDGGVIVKVDRVASPNGVVESTKIITFIWNGTRWNEKSRSVIVL